MDIAKLEGYLDAIEQEATQPQPSHANLARLVAMFMRAIVETYKQPAPPEQPPVTVGSSEGASVSIFKRKAKKAK